MKKITVRFSRFLMGFSLTAVSVLLMIVGFVLHANTKSFIDDKMEQIVSMKISQATVDVKKQFDDAYLTMDSLRNNEHFRKTATMLSSDSTASYQKVVLSHSLESTLFNFKKDIHFIENIVVIFESAQYVALQPYFQYSLAGNIPGLFRDMEGIQFVLPGNTYDLLHTRAEPIADPVLRTNIDKLNRSTYFISPIRQWNPDDGGDRSVGYVIALLHMPGLASLVPNGQSVAIVSSEDDVLFQGSEVEQRMLQPPGQVSYRNPFVVFENKRYYERDIGFQGLKMILTSPVSDFHVQQIRTLSDIAFGVLLGCALLSAVLMRMISGTILQPVHKLLRWIERYGNPDDRWKPPLDAAKPKRRLSMRDRLFIYFMITILLPICLFVSLFYVRSSQVALQEVKQMYDTAFETSAHRVALYMTRKESVLDHLAFDSALIQYVSDPASVGETEVEQQIVADKIALLNRDILSVYAVDNRLLYSNRYVPVQPMPQPLYETMTSTRKKMFFHLQAESGHPSILLGKAAYDLNDVSQPLAFLTLDMDETDVSGLYSDLKLSGSVSFIADRSGRIISHATPEYVGQIESLPAPIDQLHGRLAKEDSFLYFVKPVGGDPWYLVSKYDYSIIRKQAAELFYNDLYILIIVFLLALLFSYIMSQYLVRPLAIVQAHQMPVKFKEVRKLLKNDVYIIDEVDQLQQSFNRMIERIEQFIEEKIIGDRRQMLLQIGALQAQINPHFLHNTLENIMFLIEKGEREGAIEMIGLLSRLFRYSMGKDDPMTTVEQEIHYAKAYCEVMELRFNNKFSYDWNVDPQASRQTVVKMILQPLIENAIRHNALLVQQQILIRIACFRQEDRLILSVSDNGSGIPAEKLADIRRQLGGNEPNALGLYNVHNRIQLHYGSEYGLTIESEHGRGTRVRLTLPFTDDAEPPQE